MIKWIIVTGDTGGLGFAITNSILENKDYGVIGISRKRNTKTDILIEEYGKRYKHINFDLKNTNDIRLLYKNEIKKIGAVYGLVNNSAYAYDDIVTNANLNELDEMFSVNVFSAIMLSKFAIRDMLLNKVEGSLVHITSVCAHTGYKGLSMYAATKGALESFSRTVAREWGEVGIRSNCVAPGFMETGMSKSLSELQKNRIYKRTSLKKDTDVTSVAKMVAFLLKEDSVSITGAVVNVDNGTI